MLRFLIVITLPILFFAPFFFLESYNKKSSSEDGMRVSEIIPSAPGESLEKLGLPNLLETFSPIEHKHYKPLSLKIDAPKLSFFINEPQPLKEDALYPIIIHLTSTKNLVSSAFIMAQPSIDEQFSAFNLIVQTQKGKEINATKLFMGLAQSLIKISEDLPIDPKRIYIAGCGSDASNVIMAIKMTPDLYRAGIMFSGGSDYNANKTIGNTSLLIINGRNNERFSAITTQKIASNIKKQGGDIAYKAIKHMKHDCSHPALYSDNTWKWLFSKT